MIQFLIAAVTLLVLAEMSRRVNRRYSHLARLPMQWSLDGAVNWTAPRKIALAFTPTLAAVVLLFVAVLSFVSEPRPGQAGYEAPVTLFVAFVFIAIHALHIWLIKKALR